VSTDDHSAYGVRLVVEHFRRTYVAWCQCGWTGLAVPDDDEAGVLAFTHATGRAPEVKPPRPRRPKGEPPQTEALFDAEMFRRKG
jgi:hypothetical protein